ncbi:MAG: DUF1735 domain-containing protein [Prevotella sp.]|nr:DUF1735 domain-containing protein [Prevotella sp.]
MTMNKKISYMLSMLLAGALFTSCKNGDASFPDYEGGTTVYFAYQYPVRTIVLGDDEYDLTLDHAHKCQIQATFGGSYNGSNGSVQVAVDPTLVNNLTFADGTPVKVMPSEYYTLSTTDLKFNGKMNGVTEVQLTDAFFNDPDAVKNTYVIPLVMTGQTGFGRILTGELKEGGVAIRTDGSQWETLPMDYVLYCVKFQNKYSGYWLTNGNSSIDNIEKAGNVLIETKSLNQSVYHATVDGEQVDLLLTFDNDDNCSITCLTPGKTASGSGSFTDGGAKKSWGNKDRDLLELVYKVDGTVVTESLVWQRSGVKSEEFTPTYN